MKNEFRLARVRSLAEKCAGDPRSVFYGDVTVNIDPEDAADAVAGKADPTDAVEQAIITDEKSDLQAAAKLAAYNAMPASERAGRTLLPALACWNAIVVISPMLGRVLAKALDYMLLKTLNEYPYEGNTFVEAVRDDDAHTATITIDSRAISGTGIAKKYIAIPFFRFTIASSTLNAAPGAQIKIDVRGKNAEGREVDTARDGYTYSFQRINNTEAVIGIYLPTVVVATRTLPFLPIAGDQGGTDTPINPEQFVITFSGVGPSDLVSVTVPGYATAELKEISAMYNLPAGQIR